MPLTPATLSTELLAISDNHPADEASAIIAWSAAYRAFLEESSLAGVPLAFGAAGEAAMIGAMAGFATLGFTAVQNGSLAFWGALNVPGSFGPLSVPPLVVPAGLAALAATLVPIGVTNTTAKNSNAVSSDAIAVAWAAASIGGTMSVLPVPTPTPIL